MDNPFTWDALTRTPAAADVFAWPAMVFFVVFAIGFVAAAYLANQGSRRFASHPAHRRAIQHLAGLAVYVFGAGLFFFGVRALNINPFSFGSPIWLWLSVLALIVLAIYAFRYWTHTYPARRAAFDQRQLKESYIRPGKRPAPGTAPVGRTRSSAQKPTENSQPTGNPPTQKDIPTPQ
jgi:hypothetical protein